MLHLIQNEYRNYVRFSMNSFVWSIRYTQKKKKKMNGNLLFQLKLSNELAQAQTNKSFAIKSVLWDIPDTNYSGKNKFHWFACHWGESNFRVHVMQFVWQANAGQQTICLAKPGKWKINTVRQTQWNDFRTFEQMRLFYRFRYQQVNSLFGLQ